MHMVANQQIREGKKEIEGMVTTSVTNRKPTTATATVTATATAVTRTKEAKEAEKVVEQNTHYRSVIKGISWRLVATLTTIILSVLITGNMKAAIKIGPMDFVLKLIIFYLHERLWLLEKLQQLQYKRGIKMACWKAIAVSLTMSTTFYVTGELTLAFKLGPADFTAKLLLYYLHELVWQNISYGKTVIHKKTQ